ncbi:hypothetical protein BDW67DRAFT_32002 [Aspergillus spinulosporus]
MPISVGSPLGSSPSILLIFLVPPNLRTQLRKGKKRVKFEKELSLLHCFLFSSVDLPIGLFSPPPLQSSAIHPPNRFVSGTFSSDHYRWEFFSSSIYPSFSSLIPPASRRDHHWSLSVSSFLPPPFLLCPVRHTVSRTFQPPCLSASAITPGEVCHLNHHPLLLSVSPRNSLIA